MQVTLNIGEDQMKVLEQDLTNFLSNLDIEQKTKLLETYMDNHLRGLILETTSDSYFSSGSTHLTELGKILFGGLQDKVADTLVMKIFNDESLKKRMDDITSRVTENLDATIQKGVSEYIVNKIFYDKEAIVQIIYNEINQRLNSPPRY